MNLLVATYGIYLVLCIGVTIWVGRTLRKFGRVFVTDGNEHKREIHDALSHLLVVGFYLINFGVVTLMLKHGPLAVNTMAAAMELLSSKVGTILLVLGGMHFLILMVVNNVRRNSTSSGEVVTATRAWKA